MQTLLTFYKGDFTGNDYHCLKNCFHQFIKEFNLINRFTSSKNQILNKFLNGDLSVKFSMFVDKIIEQEKNIIQNIFIKEIKQSQRNNEFLIIKIQEKIKGIGVTDGIIYMNSLAWAFCYWKFEFNYGYSMELFPLENDLFNNYEYECILHQQDRSPIDIHEHNQVKEITKISQIIEKAILNNCISFEIREILLKEWEIIELATKLEKNGFKFRAYGKIWIIEPIEKETYRKRYNREFHKDIDPLIASFMSFSNQIQ